jgi:cytochrome c oxidase subunit II
VGGAGGSRPPGGNRGGVSDTTNGVWDRVFDVYAPLALGVFVLIASSLVFILIRWRARGRDEFPGGRDERNPVEIAYAVLLIVVATGLIVLTLTANDDLEAQFDSGADISVDVTGARWNWRFEYPDLGIVDQGTREHIPTLTVPAGEPIDFTGTSVDVIHSFWIPDERFKRDVFAQRETDWQMTFDEEGFMSGVGRCAEFCGLRHSDMRFNVDVLSPEAFDAWARRQGNKAGP